MNTAAEQLPGEAVALLAALSEDGYLPSTPLAEGFAYLLSLLAEGEDPADAVVLALVVCQDAAEKHLADTEAYRAWKRAEDERAKQAAEDWPQRKAAAREYVKVREHQALTRECPFCGSPPGTRCRSTGLIGNSMTYAHAARVRHAGTLP